MTAEIDVLVGDGEEDPLDLLIPDDAMKGFDWGTGVEEYEAFSMDQLWDLLGVSATKAIPFFNDKEDPIGLTDPWTDEGIKALNAPSAVPLAPRWHQLIGIIKMLDNYLGGKPTLLMDGVGVGKTMQVIGTVCFLAFYREYYEKHGHFPGKYGASYSPPPLQRADASPSENKVSQHQGRQRPRRAHHPHHPRRPRDASHRRVPSLRPREDLRLRAVHRRRAQEREIVLGNGRQVCPAEDPPVRARHRPGTSCVRSLAYLLTPLFQSVDKDGVEMFRKDESKPWGAGNMIKRPEGQHEPRIGRTIYSRDWGMMIVDEVHSMRRLNKLYTAVRSLRNQTAGMIGMTATPTITNPMVCTPAFPPFRIADLFVRTSPKSGG